MEPLQPELCCIRKAYADLVLLGWFCYYRGGSWFLVTEQKSVLLVHHLTVVIHCTALILLPDPGVVLWWGGVSDSLCTESQSVTPYGVRTWKMC